MKTPLLNRIQSPADMKSLDDAQLKQLADELRADTIDAVSETGGHLGAGLGVVELTVALHHVFDTPNDKLIWDVGHQAYPHKILTGRRDGMRKIRQAGGPSGFCKRSESEYDAFGAGHSSTSISAGLGMAVARDLKPSPSGRGLGEGVSTNETSQGAYSSSAPSGETLTPALSQRERELFDIISIIGDGAMSAGMAFEALNNAGAMGNRLIVILNDNDMSIAPPVGAMSAYLARLISSRPYHKLRDLGKKVASVFPEPMADMMRRAEHLARDVAVGGTLFEQLGFYYVGPVDGHNLDHLLPVLRNVRNEKNSGPVLIHVVTEKGCGFNSPDASAEKFHAVATFDTDTLKQNKPKTKAPTYTKTFANALIQEAAQDERVVAITAAMPSGTGLDKFADTFPERMFDVGIAEQHAVTFAAGMATEGMKPFVAIYSTFLQRAFDQIVHDVAIQNLPVRFAIDRAGLVGADGATHAGSFDIAYLCCLPNMVVAAAADEAELVHLTATAAHYSEGPFAYRYPRGEGVGVAIPEKGHILPIGKGRMIQQGEDVAIISFGARLEACKEAAAQLATQGITPTIADSRFAKPLDEGLVRKLASGHRYLFTIEEGSQGGFSSQVLHFAAREGLLDGNCQIIPLTLPDEFMDHDKPEAQYAKAGLDAAGIAKTIEAWVEKDQDHSKQYA